jgi:cell division protein ZipA
VYLWGRGLLRLKRRRPHLSERSEPKINASETTEPGPTVDPSTEAGIEALLRTDDGSSGPKRRTRPVSRPPDKIVTLRIVPRGAELPTGEETVLTLRSVGLEHGTYGIFHKLAEGDTYNPVFSVARLTQPGAFDLTTLTETKIPGLSVFMALPGTGDPVERFDSMLETARTLARELNAELLDEKGSSWSVQRERYLREEMIQYRHTHQRG